MYLQANQKLRHLRIKQFDLLAVANNVNEKLKTDYLLDETIACIPIFNKIETSLMNLEASILKIKLEVEKIEVEGETKNIVDKKIVEVASDVTKTDSESQKVPVNETDQIGKKIDSTKNANFLRKIKSKENIEISNENSGQEPKRKSLLERVSIKGSAVQVPKIEIIKDAAKVWEGKVALKKAFKARDTITGTCTVEDHEN